MTGWSDEFRRHWAMRKRMILTGKEVQGVFRPTAESMVRHWVKHSTDEKGPIEEAVAHYMELITQEYCFLVCDDMAEDGSALIYVEPNFTRGIEAGLMQDTRS